MGFYTILLFMDQSHVSRLAMQIGGTISEIHLKNTHFTYTLAAPAPQNTTDCGNRVNTPVSVKCRQVTPNSSLIHCQIIHFNSLCLYPSEKPIDPIKEKRSRLETYVELTLCHILPSVQIQYKVDLNYT